jgi:hypothetical protein
VVGALLRRPLPLDLLSCRCLWSHRPSHGRFPLPNLRTGYLGCLCFLISLFVSPFLRVNLCVASVLVGSVNVRTSHSSPQARASPTENSAGSSSALRHQAALRSSLIGTESTNRPLPRQFVRRKGAKGQSGTPPNLKHHVSWPVFSA